MRRGDFLNLLCLTIRDVQFFLYIVSQRKTGRVGATPKTAKATKTTKATTTAALEAAAAAPRTTASLCLRRHANHGDQG